MSKKQPYKRYSAAFKKEAVSLVTEQGYSVADAAASLGIRTNQLYEWKKQQETRQGYKVTTQRKPSHAVAN